jgi:hypothetical protein
MQAPQLLGIFLGIFAVAIGWLLRRNFLLKQKATVGSISFAILFYIGALTVLQNIVFDYPPTWSWHGVFLVWANSLGQALVPIALGFLGLLYKPNRVAGYIVVLALFAGLMFVGS